LKIYSRVLCVSDLHAPYCHIDIITYLKALKKKYKPDLVVLLGDELDYHAMSFHDSDPDLDSAGIELCKGINIMKGVFRVFPEAKVLESNHGSMKYRKAKHHGMPRHLIKTYMDVLDSPDEWSWHPSLKIKTPRGFVLFKHQFSANSILESQRRGLSIVQGHHHSQLDIRYWATIKSKPNALYYPMRLLKKASPNYSLCS